MRGARRGRRRDLAASVTILRQGITRLADGRGTVSLTELRRHLDRAELSVSRVRLRGGTFALVQLSPYATRLSEWLRGERKAG